MEEIHYIHNKESREDLNKYMEEESWEVKMIAPRSVSVATGSTRGDYAEGGLWVVLKKLIKL
jgi:hypothetical protein